MAKRQQNANRSLVSVRPKSRRLLERMAENEDRSLIDQMTVIIREAAEARGLPKTAA